MPRARKVCSVNHCTETVRGQGRCPTHATQADRARGTAHQRGYGQQHRIKFRTAVLKRDKQCVCPPDHQLHANKQCGSPSTVADHHPRTRRELEAAGADPYDPSNGRGLCPPCHGYRTTLGTPGGFNSSLRRR